MYETHNNKVYKELLRDYGVVGITDYVSLIAERIPEEEINANPGHFINAFHFQGEPNKPHGIPFRFLIKPVRQPRDIRLEFHMLTNFRMRGLQTQKSD
jgi:ubiquitin carboxyl-terminal hydrolase 7